MIGVATGILPLGLENNYKKNNNNIFQGTGDMNILAQPNEKLQPNNLLKLKDYKEDWNPKDLLNFYKSSKVDFIQQV